MGLLISLLFLCPFLLVKQVRQTIKAVGVGILSLGYGIFAIGWPIWVVMAIAIVLTHTQLLAALGLH